jgi:pimeloyl-ACP methyl ester carboxylesterase
VYAHRYPGDVASFVSVEGNFTLADAFWSAELAKKPAAEAEALLAGYRADPAGWLGGSPSADQVASASRMLCFQPARTSQAMAASIVAVTGAPSWQSLLQEVFARTPVHLVAGEHSRSAWNVPDWALSRARSYTEMPGVGHLMTIERPEAFGDVVSGLLEP